MQGTVRAIHLAPSAGDPVKRVETVEAVAERGLKGDRYYAERGTFDGGPGNGITLIEREAIEAVEREHGVALEDGRHRRNVTTEGVALNHLVGERFSVGEAVCLGEELCEPCSYLEGKLGEEGVREALVHRGGLRARIVESGTITAGDSVGEA